MNAAAIETIRQEWGKKHAQEIAIGLGCSISVVSKTAAKLELGPGVSWRHRCGESNSARIWPEVDRRQPWPTGETFTDIADPDCDRWPSMGYRPLRAFCSTASIGCAALMCAEMGR